MVRLSEALAKLSASGEILLQHVTEAAYLLKTSIVHVEQESMSLDVPQTAEDQVGEMDQDGMVMDEVMDETTKKKKITLTAQDYNKICKSIVLQIQRHERSTNDAGMTRSSIINWYLEMMEQAEQIDTEDDYLYQKKLIKTVLGRMVNVVNLKINPRKIH
jgi:DNA replication licensing factor MCM6